MPQKEIDLVINDRDIEQAEKKLRSMDSLLQQTQRRAAVLGQTRMTPVISLDDRFTTKARLITHRLTLLDRMSANPIVWLIDNASAGINKIRNSLSRLTQPPWRVTILGPNWDEAAGTSFADLFGNESLYTEVGKKAGTTYFEAFLSVLDPLRITDILGQLSMANGGQVSTGDQGSGSDGGGWKEGTLDFVKEVAAGILVDILSKKIGGKMSELGDFLSKKVTPGKVKDPLKSPPKVTSEISKSASKSISKTTTKAASKGVSPTAKVAEEFVSTIPSRLDTYGRRGKFLSKTLPFAGKLLTGAGMLLTIKNTQEYMDNSGMSDLVRKAPKLIWDDLNTPPRTEVNGKPVEDMGVIKYTIELGKETYNRVTNKETWKNTYGDALKSMKPFISRENLSTLFFGEDVSDEVERTRAEREKKKEQSNAVQGNTINDSTSKSINETLNKIGYINPIERINQIIKGTKFINSDSSIQFPTNQSAVSGINSNNIKQEVDHSVNVSVTPGAINLTVQKDEINYEDIAQKTGSLIANQVRFAMMNMS
ncbi:hypothetical protein DMN77_05435 [Paenibacillus sp. 79R4]|uniref:hypothetical protein n=1 Tax=Paenibacillus sp. 79R4 TaxID=2212847 RepID=UPI0015B7DB2D|nr:hypothetical protein [Paenibacillus sp. 79R4]NWL87040.1 hypothetical protein [Paenibacillus sp. 79R4]